MFSLSFTLVPAVVPDDPEKKPVEEAEDEQGKKKENVGVGIDHSDTVDFIRSNNHTIAQAHDISCVCMHPLCIGYALSTTFALLRVSNLAGQNFRTSAFFIAKLVFMAGLDHLPEVSVSVHSPSVNSVQIAVAGPIEFHLYRENTVFHTGYGLFIILDRHQPAYSLLPSLSSAQLIMFSVSSFSHSSLVITDT